MLIHPTGDGDQYKPERVQNLIGFWGQSPFYANHQNPLASSASKGLKTCVLALLEMAGFEVATNGRFSGGHRGLSNSIHVAQRAPIPSVNSLLAAHHPCIVR